MKSYRIKKVQEVSALTCDRCGVTVESDVGIMEFQEFLEVKIHAGFGTVFEDGSIYECDLCQRCGKELLGEYLRKTGEYL